MHVTGISMYPINNNNYIYPGYPHYLHVFQWGPASKLQLFTILIVNI